jgi:hypothetical protein
MTSVAATTQQHTQHHEAFPALQRHVALLVDGVHTEVLVTMYVDRVLCVVTQRDKMGTLVTASKDVDEASVGTTFSTQTLLGRDEGIANMLARLLVARLAAAGVVRRPLLLSLALRDNDVEADSERGAMLVRTLLAVIVEHCKLW